MKHIILLITILTALLFGYQSSELLQAEDPYHFANENHLSNIRMLTSEGENAEAYFSFDQQKLIFLPGWKENNLCQYSCRRFSLSTTTGFLTRIRLESLQFIRSLRGKC